MEVHNQTNEVQIHTDIESLDMSTVVFEIGVMTVTAVPLCKCAPDLNVEVAFAPISTGKH